MKKYTAFYFASKIAEVMRGSSSVPRKSGLLQDNSINALEITPSLAIVAIGGEQGVLAHYAPYLEFSDNAGREPFKADQNGNIKLWAINKHKGWTARIIENEVIPFIKTLGDKV